MLSPNELNREASIVIRKLAKKKAWLEQRRYTETGKLGLHAQSKSKWVVINARTKSNAKPQSIEYEVVEVMKSKGWLVADPTGALIISSLVTSNKENTKPNKQLKGPGFIGQHQLQKPAIIKDQEQRTIFTTRNETESPLGWMRARKDKAGNPLIDDFQFEAGERLRADFTMAQLSPRVTANWDFTGGACSSSGRHGGDVLEMSEKVVAAKQRLFNALDVLGPEMSSIVLEVCCLMSGLESAERALGWPRRSAKLVLAIALTKLSQHYGLVVFDSKQVRKKAIRHWGKNGYQPQVPAARKI